MLDILLEADSMILKNSLQPEVVLNHMIWF